jgi:hypothetical protein
MNVSDVIFQKYSGVESYLYELCHYVKIPAYIVVECTQLVNAESVTIFYTLELRRTKVSED